MRMAVHPAGAAKLARRACVMRASESEMLAGGKPAAAEMAAPAAARERERRNEGGTDHRRYQGGAPNGAGHGLHSLRFHLSRRAAFRFTTPWIVSKLPQRTSIITQ